MNRSSKIVPQRLLTSQLSVVWTDDVMSYPVYTSYPAMMRSDVPCIANVLFRALEFRMFLFRALEFRMFLFIWVLLREPLFN